MEPDGEDFVDDEDGEGGDTGPPRRVKPRMGHTCPPNRAKPRMGINNGPKPRDPQKNALQESKVSAGFLCDSIYYLAGSHPGTYHELMK